MNDFGLLFSVWGFGFGIWGLGGADSYLEKPDRVD
jgi:hypothetical protein